MKKCLALCLSLLMLFGLLVPGAAAASVEMPTVLWSSADPLIPAVRTYQDTLEDVSDAWCAEAVVTVYEAGLMEGKTSTRFDITSPLTNAQIVVIAARLHSLLRNGDGTMEKAADGQPWYQPSLSYLLAAERTGGSLLPEALERDSALADQPCTRENFVKLLDAVMVEEAHPREVLNPTAVPPDCRDASVIRFYQAGILTGSDVYGTFHSSASLTRGAAAAILARLAAPLQRQRLELMSFDLCRDVLGVEPGTILLTVNGEEIPAELFAEQLCTSLYQWEGNAKNALKDAIQFWCWYQGAFRVMAEELGISIPAEKQEDIRLEAEEKDGYLGLPAAYWQFRSEGSSLNQIMNDLYYEKDWKAGVGYYHSDLEKISESMTQNAVPTAALESMDLQAVYQRLMKSPYVQWQFDYLSRLP